MTLHSDVEGENNYLRIRWKTEINIKFTWP